MTISIVSVLVALLVLAIFYYLASLFDDPKLQRIAKVIIAIIFLVWLIGLITGKSILHLTV